MKRALALIATLLALVLPVVPTPALAHDEEYLALGDSVAFGTNPLLDRADADNFVGYAEALARMLDLDVTNASCPGEASGGFISLTGVDNVCRPYRARFPLHEDYTTSQLDFAVAFLRDNPDTQLVTLNIGANDLFVLQKQCAASADPLCFQNGFPKMLATLAQNLRTIYTAIRRDANFHGELVALTYYSLNYNDAGGVAVISAINGVVAQVTLAAGGRVASGFDAWKPVAFQRGGGDSCAAGLLIVVQTTPQLKCDIHPSPAGRDLLAKAIAAQVTAAAKEDRAA